MERQRVFLLSNRRRVSLVARLVLLLLPVLLSSHTRVVPFLRLNDTPFHQQNCFPLLESSQQLLLDHDLHSNAFPTRGT